MMQPGFAMPQPQQGVAPQAYMMPQGGNLQPGVQYMQMVLPVEQARMMAQNGIVPMGRVPGPQMQMMPQGACKGGCKGGKGGPAFGMHGGPMPNWGNQAKGFQGFQQGFNNGGKGKGDPDDGKFDDWVAQRMGKKPASTSSPSSPDRSSQQMKPDQQMRQMPQQRHAQMQPMPFGQPQQMQAWQLPSPQLQQQLAQQHEVQQQQQQLWMQQQQQWQWPQNNMGMQNGTTDFGSSGGGGADSPRTMEWRRKIAESNAANPTGEADVNDWISKRSEALADGPAHRAPSGAAMMQTIEEDESPHHPSVPWDAVAPLFENTKPWADVTDADEKKTQEQILEIIQREEEQRKVQDDEQDGDEEFANRMTEAMESAEPSLSSTKAPIEPPEKPNASDSCAPPPSAAQAKAPSTKASPPAVSEPTRSYAAAAKQAPQAAAKRAPVVSPPPATEVEGTRSNAPIEVAPTESKEVLQKPAQDTQGSTAAVTEEPATTAAKSDVEKRKKALQKKLRQINDLEKKAENGTELNSEERQKLATKAALEEELKEL